MLDICTSCPSTLGVEEPATWLDVMDSDERVRLLFGMAPENRKYWGTALKAAATFLSWHLEQQRGASIHLTSGTDSQRFGLPGKEPQGRPSRSTPWHILLYAPYQAHSMDRSVRNACGLGRQFYFDGQGFKQKDRAERVCAASRGPAPMPARFNSRWQNVGSYHEPQVLGLVRISIQNASLAERLMHGIYPSQGTNSGTG